MANVTKVHRVRPAYAVAGCVVGTLALAGAACTTVPGATVGESENVGHANEALNSVTVYQDPSGSQTITQPSGSSFTVSGTAVLPNPKNVGAVRYADQFSGTDIGAQVNSALADLVGGSCPGNGGGTIVIPKGSWTFSTTINLDNCESIVLTGEGAATPGSPATKLTFSGGAGTTAISARSTLGIAIRGLFLTSSTAASHTFVDFRHNPSNTGCQSAPCDTEKALVEDCSITPTAGGGIGIDVDQADDTTIQRSFFNNLTVAIQGIDTTHCGSHYANGIRIIENSFGNLITTVPINNYGAAWVVDRNIFEGVTAGSIIKAGAISHDAGCAGDGMSFSGNWLGDTKTDTTGVWVNWIGSGLVAQNNQFSAGNKGILVDTGYGTAISGNHFGTTTGVDLTAGPQGVAVMGNDFTTTATPISRSTTAPMVASLLLANLGPTSTTPADYTAAKNPWINVRTIVTKSIADNVCQAAYTGSVAAYTPQSYVGLTGTAICNANINASHTTCRAVQANLVFTVSNAVGAVQTPTSCSTAIEPAAGLAPPWPWGTEPQVASTGVPAPDTNDEWEYTTVVCCM